MIWKGTVENIVWHRDVYIVMTEWKTFPHISDSGVGSLIQFYLKLDMAKLCCLNKNYKWPSFGNHRYSHGPKVKTVSWHDTQTAPQIAFCSNYRHKAIQDARFQVIRSLIFEILHYRFIGGGVNLKVRGLTGTWGGCRHRNAKIWGKKGRFCKNLATTGRAIAPQPPGCAAYEI